MKTMFAIAFLIIIFSLFLSVKTHREMNRMGNYSRIYSGTLIDMISPDVSIVYDKYSNPGLEYKKIDFEDNKIVSGRK